VVMQPNLKMKAKIKIPKRSQNPNIILARISVSIVAGKATLHRIVLKRTKKK